MNKSKIVLAATGGVIGVAVLVMAYLVWSAFAAKTAAMEGDDETEGLETVQAEAGKLSRKPVYPCAASVKAVSSNEAAVAGWRDEAFKLAARGDRPVKALTPAQFKTDMMEDAKRLLALPGAVVGKIAKPDFTFGPFKEYIAEGKMPSESKLAELQRQWDDISMIVEILSAAGVAEILDIQLRQAQAPVEEEQPVRGRKPRRKVQQANGEAASAAKFDRQDYTVTFTAKPPALVKCVNAFGTGERFIVVEDFSFTRENDVIAAALGGGEKKDAAQQTSGRRRGRRAVQAAEEKPDEKAKNGIITDPLGDAPLKVSFQVTTYDFKTLQEAPKEEEKK